LLTFLTLFRNDRGREQGKSQSFAMKKNQLVSIAALFVAMSVAAPSAFALTAAQTSAIKKAVTGVAVPEMPAMAAELVVKASKEDREAVAVTAVRAAIYKNRSAAASVVAAVAKVAPDLASAITLAATQMERDQVSAIASAAITAAPGARTAITSSANTGFRASAPAPVAMAGASSAGSFSTGTSVVPMTSPAFAGFERASAATPVVVVVTQRDTTIQGTTFPPGGASAGPSTPVDYTRPRTL
jgi:hypothetical protein